VKLTRCNRPGCGDEIWWAETTEGKNMPVNKWSTASGNVVPVDPEADKPVVIVLKKGEEPDDPTARRYLAHFVTCKAKRKPRR
jgi:hypothetical protein